MAAASAPHLPTNASYQAGCRCDACRQAHSRTQAPYSAAAYRRRKAELTELRAFRAGVLALLDRVAD